MIRLIVSTVVVLLLSCSADPRSPRVYNVLISSNKNLSPSHAQPVYEPVLRTTSIGYVLPSYFYHSSFVQNVPATYINPDYRRIDTSIQNQNGEIPSQHTPQSVSAISTQQYEETPNSQNPQQLNQANRQAAVVPEYLKYLPNEQTRLSEKTQPFSALPSPETDPKNIVANLKKNPNIPDVPPPPLPVRVLKQQ